MVIYYVAKSPLRVMNGREGVCDIEEDSVTHPFRIPSQCDKNDNPYSQIISSTSNDVLISYN